MRALVRYWLHVTVRSQRYFPPLTLFVIGVVVLTANGTGPLAGAYGAAATVLFLAASWMIVAVLAVDDADQHAVITANSGSRRRVVLAAVLVNLLACSALTVFGLLFPAFSGLSAVSTGAVAVGVVMHATAAMTGTTVGLVSSRLVIGRLAVRTTTALVLATVCLALPWASPLGPALALADRGAPAGHVLPSLTALMFLATAVLGLAWLLVDRIAYGRS